MYYKIVLGETMPINAFDNYSISWKPDKNSLIRPFYLSLAAILESDIKNGLLAPDSKLPPQRELADFLGINFTTVTRAYKICTSRGLIYAVTGSGTFVSSNAARSIAISTDKIPSGFIDLGFVASFEQTNEIVTETIRKVSTKTYVKDLLNYGDPTGMPHHKQAGISWMEPLGIRTDTEHMSIVSGTQNALAIALIGLFEPGNRIVTDLYTYANFIELAKTLQLKLIPVEGDKNGILPDELDSLCRQIKIHGIFLMPSCCNPTTVKMTDLRKRQLADVIRKHGIILIEDDVMAFLTAGKDPEYVQPMFNLLPEQSVYVCSTAKSICSGLRVAYMVYGDTLKPKILQAIFNVNIKTSSLDAEVISELITSGKATEIAGIKGEMAAESNAIYDEYFPESGASGHKLSFYRWLPILKKYDINRMDNDLRQSNIRVLHSNRFLCGKASNERFLRVALSSVDSPDELRTGLRILKDYIDELESL
jgi:DNA-binding transcriptional MocR family regulator